MSQQREKTLPAYVTGFLLCCVMTISAFYLVRYPSFERSTTYLLLSVLAISQLFIQSVCFLRLSKRGEGLWNLLPFLFVIMVVVILAGGSLWIMYNLNCNMMTH